jgi:hypothetical protein
MAKTITTKFGGTCADKACGVSIPKGAKVRWYGRGRIYCKVHPNGKGSRSVPARHEATPTTAIFSPDLASNIVESFKKGHFKVESEEDIAFLRKLEEGMRAASEDTKCQSIADDLAEISEEVTTEA